MLPDLYIFQSLTGIFGKPANLGNWFRAGKLGCRQLGFDVLYQVAARGPQERCFFSVALPEASILCYLVSYSITQKKKKKKKLMKWLLCAKQCALCWRQNLEHMDLLPGLFGSYYIEKDN